MQKYALSVAAVCVAWLALGLVASASAANWFQLEGVSNPKWGRGKTMIFMQPLYAHAVGSQVFALGRMRGIKPNLIGPEFHSNERLTVFRARVMLRGHLTHDVSYFLGGEFGDNGYNYVHGSYRPHLIDAHVTFSNFVPGMRIEVGNIRAPGPQGAMQGIPAYTFYDRFPTAIGQLMATRYFDKKSHYNVDASGGHVVPGSNISGSNGFRYPGVMAFDWFALTPKLQLSYGVMVGSYGHMFDSSTANGAIYAGRVQLEHLLGGGKGPYRNGLAGYVWYQQANPKINGISHGMTRQGLGFTYLNGFMTTGGVKLQAEYLEGKGNIRVPKPFVRSSDLSPAQYATRFYAGKNNKASGYYVLGGVFATPHVELIARYDYYDRMKNSAALERQFKTLALGVEYRVTSKIRIVGDYYIRNLKIPHLDALGPVGSPHWATAMRIKHAFGNVFNVYAVWRFGL